MENQRRIVAREKFGVNLFNIGNDNRWSMCSTCSISCNVKTPTGGVYVFLDRWDFSSIPQSLVYAFQSWCTIEVCRLHARRLISGVEWAVVACCAELLLVYVFQSCRKRQFLWGPRYIKKAKEENTKWVIYFLPLKFDVYKTNEFFRQTNDNY